MAESPSAAADSTCDVTIDGLTMLPGSKAIHRLRTFTWPSASDTSAMVAVSELKGDAIETPRARLPSVEAQGPRFQPPDNSPTVRSRLR
ncbi:hypothetical protein J2X65_000861 [Ancylobacter sp. 3268]|nr:hypothetical protein [Ancylobacter sp. 3268]